MFMAGQDGDRGGPRRAVLPPEPSASRRPPAPTMRRQPPAEPLTSGILKAANGRQQTAPGTQQPGTGNGEQKTARPRITRTSEFMEELDRRWAAAQSQASPPEPRFDQETYEFMRRVRGPEQPRQPMDWSGIKFRHDAAPPPLSGATIPRFPAVRQEMPKDTPPAPTAIVSSKLWSDAGLPLPWQKKREPKKPQETPDIKKNLDAWSKELSHPAEEVLLNVFIESAVEEFSGWRKASREGHPSLVMVCSGGRAPYMNESDIGGSIGTVSGRFLHELNKLRAVGAINEGEADSFVEKLIRSVLSVTPPAEGEAKTDLEMRNGFLRACAWCICTSTSPPLLSEFFSRNNISLIDGVGIATGLATNEAGKLLGEEGVRASLYRLTEKRWVSSGFEHLKEMLRKDLMGHRLSIQDVSRFTLLLLREVAEYQKIAQYCSTLARNVRSISQQGGKGAVGKQIYLDDRSFYLLLRTRTCPGSPIWKDVGMFHDFVAQRIARHSPARDSGVPSYSIGRRPREIAQLFSSLLGSLDFLSESDAIRETALTALERYDFSAPPAELFGEDSEAFRKLFALCLFTSHEDAKRHPKLLASLRALNPFVADVVDEHMDDLMTGRLSRIIPPRPEESAATDTDDSDAPF